MWKATTRFLQQSSNISWLSHLEFLLKNQKKSLSQAGLLSHVLATALQVADDINTHNGNSHNSEILHTNRGEEGNRQEKKSKH